MRLRLLTKMLLAFGIASLLTASLGLVAFLSLNRIVGPLQAISADTLPSLVALEELTGSLSHHRLSVANLALLDDAALLPQQEIVIDQANKRLETAWSGYRKHLSTSEDKEIAAGLEKSIALYTKASAVVLEASRRNDRQAVKTSLESVRALYNVAASYQDKLVQNDAALAREGSTEAAAAYRQAQIFLIVMSLVAVAVSLLLGAFMARRMSRPIRELAESVRVVAAGDLTQPDLAPRGDDEVADLTRDINHMTASLRALLGQLQASIGDVAEVGAGVSAGAGATAESVDQVSVTLQEVARGIQEQTEAISRIAANAERVHAGAHTIAAGAEEQSGAIRTVLEVNDKLTCGITALLGEAETVTELAHEAERVSGTGHAAVTATVQGMATVEQAVRSASDAMNQLDQYSGKIGTILTAITGIAEQTNLLALNAAIESARAGEAGRGFAVVAEEVRKLAGRSATSAQEIAELIARMQGATGTALQAVRQGMEKVRQVVELSGSATEALDGIRFAVTRSDTAAQSIRTALQELGAGAERATAAIGLANEITQRNAMGVSEIYAQIAEMSDGVKAVAAVTEEAAASVEEISASTEEVGATAGEMASGADRLAKLTVDLQALSASFRLK